jgi:saccharopine dehydrogenase (NAD+, L-lysine-forming)
VEGGTGEETDVFLEPSAMSGLYVGHPQLTIPRYIKGVKRVVIMALIPPWVDGLIKEQKKTGFLSAEPIEVKGAKVVPYDLTLQLWSSIPENRDKGPVASGLKVIVKGERKEQVTYTADIGQDGAGHRASRLIAAHVLCRRCYRKGRGSP